MKTFGSIWTGLYLAIIGLSCLSEAIVNKVCSGNGVTDIITQNGTHLLQPTSFRAFCKYEIPKQSNICQVRLDFNEFVINQGEETEKSGDCTGDTLTISGASNTVLLGPLCGDLTGQHMYLDYGTESKISLEMYMECLKSQRWVISVTMIECSSLSQAPAGCLQYHTWDTGVVESFNYNNKTQLNNQDYSVCIRRNAGMRQISWMPCRTNPLATTDFTVSGATFAVGPPGQPAFGSVITGSQCTNDWVMVLGNDKFCGSQFPNTVSSISQPYILQVHFNEHEIPAPSPPGCGTPTTPCSGSGQSDDANEGFCLKYIQSPF